MLRSGVGCGANSGMKEAQATSMLCGVSSRAHSRESRALSPQLADGDATPFFGSSAMESSCDHSVWKDDLKQLLQQVVKEEHQVTRRSIACIQGTLDRILVSSENTMKIITESGRFDGVLESFTQEDPGTESLPFTPMSGDAVVHVETAEEVAQPSRSLPRAGAHIRSGGSVQGDTCTTTWVNFLAGTPSGHVVAELSRALSPPPAVSRMTSPATSGRLRVSTSSDKPLSSIMPGGSTENMEDALYAIEDCQSTPQAVQRRWTAAGALKAIDRRIQSIVALEHVMGWGDTGEQSQTSNPKYVSHDTFNAFSCTLILAYTVYIGISVELGVWSAQNGRARPGWLTVGDLTFTLLFVIEIIARIVVYRAQFFHGPDFRWNLFDVLLVVSQGVDFAFTWLNVSFLRIFRVMRIIKVARVLRTVRYFTELRLMVMSIVSCLTSLMWAFLLLLLVLYLTAIGILQVVEYEMSDISNPEDAPAKLFKYYGSLGASMLTLFMSISGGADWQDLLEPLAQLSRAYSLIYVLYVSFVVFGILNVLTAIFVESGSQIAAIDQDLAIQEQLRRDKSTINTIRGVFHDADKDGSGLMTLTELEELLADPKYIWAMRLIGLDVSEARELFQLLDVNETSAVSIEEFITGMMKLKGHAKGIDLATLIHDNKQMFATLQQSLEGMSERIGMLERKSESSLQLSGTPVRGKVKDSRWFNFNSGALRRSPPPNSQPEPMVPTSAQSSAHDISL